MLVKQYHQVSAAPFQERCRLVLGGRQLGMTMKQSAVYYCCWMAQTITPNIWTIILKVMEEEKRGAMVQVAVK